MMSPPQQAGLPAAPLGGNAAPTQSIAAIGIDSTGVSCFDVSTRPLCTMTEFDGYVILATTTSSPLRRKPLASSYRAQ